MHVGSNLIELDVVWRVDCADGERTALHHQQDRILVIVVRVSGHSTMPAGDPHTPRTTQLYVHSLTTQRGRMRKTRSTPTDERLLAWRK
ncbi:hypothetical protein E2562_017284 [Oryza meyeriana var. granulata]|uniref:Uncharacterized protein n=1 Tax=Oryza meyeriana var. granulata TaxID=110450 RepID=A0A6G1EM73_9ORYZ|nr:hypothetical protein E2562_017284 [Oryza meyeriana var. granulata]